MGRVEALELVTIGQRRGLSGGGGERRYVTTIDGDAATITVGPLTALLTGSLTVEGLRWVDEPVTGEVLVQTSAHGCPQPAVVEGDVVRWREPQRRVAPGQRRGRYD